MIVHGLQIISTVLLPDLANEVEVKRNVQAEASKAEFVCVTFDIWMSRGSSDIFSVIVYFINDDFKYCHYHFENEMVQMDSQWEIIRGRKI